MMTTRLEGQLLEKLQVLCGDSFKVTAEVEFTSVLAYMPNLHRVPLNMLPDAGFFSPRLTARAILGSPHSDGGIEILESQLDNSPRVLDWIFQKFKTAGTFKQDDNS